MNLTLHELSIGSSLQTPVGEDDVRRSDRWMETNTRELFALAKEALESRLLATKAALRCDECGTTGQHATEHCPFPTKHIPLFPDL